MKHPLEFFPVHLRKPFFLAFLFLTLLLFAIFQILDQPLRTDAAPFGIVSFELAGTPLAAREITESWKQLSLLLSASGEPNPDIVNVAYVFAAFGLGLDYLFMPVYALALSFATLLAAQKHVGWIHSLLVLAGYGAFAAALFDVVENYALFQVLLGRVDASYPEIAAFCAAIKFSLILFCVLIALIGWIFPTQPDGFS
jgi:hypothetical protein